MEKEIENFLEQDNIDMSKFLDVALEYFEWI